jgi:hypothetical protein
MADAVVLDTSVTVASGRGIDQGIFPVRNDAVVVGSYIS